MDRDERCQIIIDYVESRGYSFEVFKDRVYFSKKDGSFKEIYPMNASDILEISVDVGAVYTATCIEIGEYLLVLPEDYSPPIEFPSKYISSMEFSTELLDSSELNCSIEIDMSNMPYVDYSKIYDAINRTYERRDIMIKPMKISARMCRDYLRSIDKVIFNPPATIIKWRSGEKTVVKCGENETFDPEKGLVMAIVKYELGNKGNYYNQINKILYDKSEYHMTEWLAEHDEAFENPIVQDCFGFPSEKFSTAEKLAMALGDWKLDFKERWNNIKWNTNIKEKENPEAQDE